MEEGEAGLPSAALGRRRRHVYYAVAVASVVLLARSPWVLTATLSGLLGVAGADARARPLHIALPSVGLPLVESAVSRLSRHTWTYAHPLPFVEVPPWLFPLWGLAALWIADVQTLSSSPFSKAEEHAV